MQKAGSHRNIVVLHDFEVTADMVILVLERPDPVVDCWGYLDRAKIMTERIAKLVIKQVINAVMHCLSVHVSHGDIKEENLLLELNTGRALLIDFDLAEEIKGGRVETLVGKLFMFLTFCSFCPISV